MALRTASQSARRRRGKRRLEDDETTKADPVTFDADDLIKKALRHDLDASVLDAFDDSWLPRAKNVYDWCTNRKFLGIDPFPMQMYLMLELFEDYCPECSDMQWWHGGGLKVDSPLAEIKDRLSLLKFGKCKKCGKTRLDFVKGGQQFYRDELAACLGQRAGKTACVGFISTYQLHRFLTLRSPWQTFGVLANQKMLMTFVALTEKQVMESLWDSFIGKVGSSPWFDNYHKFLREEGKRLGEELFSWKTTFITYFHKKLMAHYAVADERTLRGPTRFFACVTGDTLVPTSLGLLRADELQTRSARQVVSESGLWGTVTRHFVQTSPVLRVRTQHGYELAGSPDHPVRVLTRRARLKYRRLSELRLGDVVVIKRGFSFAQQLPQLPTVPVQANNNQRYHVPSLMTAELARLLGYLAAEGGLSGPQTAKNHEKVMLFTADREIADDFRRCFATVFGRTPPETTTDDGWRFDVQSPIVVRWLYAAGAGGDCYTKRVPWVILQAPRKYVQQFIRAYFDGDGTLDQNRALIASSASFELQRQLQVLLMGLGIASHRRELERTITIKRGGRTSQEQRRYSLLTISGAALNRYGRKLGSVLPRKQATVVPRLEVECIPFSRATLRAAEVAERSSPTHRCFRCADGVERFLPLTAALQRGRLSRSSIRELAPAIAEVDPRLGQTLLRRAHTTHLYDRVVVVTEDQLVQPVYDITVLPEHNFVANAIVSSNSVDEVGWFDAKNYNKKVKGNARGVIASLSNSLATVRSAADKRRFRGDFDLPTAMMCNIGSPSSMDDEIMHLVRRAAKYTKIFAMHAPTWDINPEMPVEACRRAADEEGGLDFDRDFGAIPPLASDPFISDKVKLDRIFCRRDPPTVRLEQQEKVLTLYGGQETFIWYKVINTLPDHNIPRMIAVDTGETFNSFCVTIAHYDNTEHHIIIDQMIEINPAHGKRVFFPGVLNDLLLWLADNLRVRLFAFDRWQSTDFVHTLADKKQEVVVHSLTFAEMVAVRAALLSDQVQLPETEFKLLALRGERIEESIQRDPVSHLKLQLATIRNLGRRVVKPAKGTDDLWRTLALAVHHITELKQDFSTYIAGGTGVTPRRNLALFSVRKGTFGGTGGFPGSSASYFSKKFRGPRGLVTVKKGAGISNTAGGRQPARPSAPSLGAGARKQ